MIKKKLFYVSVNRSEQPSTMELYDIYNKKDFVVALAKELRTVEEFIKIMSRRDNILSVFSVLDYLVSFDHEFTLDDFRSFVEETNKYIQDLRVSELFFLWLTQFPSNQVEVDRSVTQDILSLYDMLIDDVQSELKNWKENFDQRVQITEEAFEQSETRMDLLFENQCTSQEVTPFEIRKIRISLSLPFNHSLYYHFDTVRLSQEWILAMYKDMIRTKRIGHIPRDSFKDLLIERESEQLIIYHQDMEQFITLAYSETNPNALQLTLDIKPYEDIGRIRQQVRSLFGTDETTEPYKTLSVSGTFYIKDHMFEKLVWHDYVMNDMIANHYLYINELEKATRFGENVTLHFENNISAILINSKNDTGVKPSILSYFRGDYIKVNITKASGSPNDLENVYRFQRILCSLLQRFRNMYDEYQRLYFQLFPGITFRPLRKLTAEEEEDITNFADKYKNVFKKTGYKTSCRPKSRVPTIISEEEARATNPLKVLRFPKDGDTTLGIPQEYLTCTDTEYPFPGIASLSGGSLFVPCCFNKNPRSSKAFLEYYRGEKVVQPKGTEHVKSEYQIIKTFGDVGKLPSSVNQFMVALMPEHMFLRIGTEDSPNSILHSLNHVKGRDKKSDRQLRTEIVNYFGRNLHVCKQENATLTLEEIFENLNDDTTYFDPRKYIRLLETYFDVNLVIFVKDKKTEEVQMMIPEFQCFHVRSRFYANKPFVFLYEHWGTSPDRYTKRLHPVCEMIGSSQDDERLYTLKGNALQNINNVYQSLFPLYPIQQNVPTIPKSFPTRTQILDTWGKARALVLEVEPNRFLYIEATQPFPPMYIPKENERFISTIQIPSLAYLSGKLNMEVVRMVKFMETTYVQFKYLGYEWKTQIRSNTDESFEKIDFPFLSYAPKVQEERMSAVAKQKQLARIVLDYTLFLYSTYAVSAMGSSDIDKFFETHTRIVPNYKYPTIVNETISANPMIMQEGVLVLASNALKDKLEFNLQYFLLYKFEELKRYKDYKILPNFWETPFDFELWKETFYLSVFERILARPSYLAVENVSIQDLQKAEGYWYNVSQSPRKTFKGPFKYLQVETQEKAIAVTQYWKKYDQLPSFQVDRMDESGGLDPVPVRVSAYNPATNVWTPSITPEDPERPVWVGFNEQGQMYVLLEIKN